LTALPENTAPLAGVTGVILAGGQSSRMGSNKALLPYRGGRFIESIHRQLAGLFDELLLVTNSPEQYAFLGCRMVPDLHPGMGALAGLHSGLYHSCTPHIFAVACDMPYLNDTLIRALLARRHQADVVIPESADGLEPLHAVYGTGCLPAMEQALLSGRRRIVSFFPHTRVHYFTSDQVATIDQDFSSFSNINTPADYFALRKNENGAHASVYPAHTAVTS
jgi:molybdopterin-guanine dinucleotide biosynthesis protein A